MAGTVAFYQVLLFSLIALLAASMVLYRTVALGAIFNRDRTIAESTVVTEATTIVSLLLTLLVLYGLFFALGYLATITVFPERLMATWPTVDPAVKVSDHIKLNLFLAAMGNPGRIAWRPRRQSRPSAQRPLFRRGDIIAAATTCLDGHP